jgi:hypothetical protein
MNKIDNKKYEERNIFKDKYEDQNKQSNLLTTTQKLDESHSKIEVISLCHVV